MRALALRLLGLGFGASLSLFAFGQIDIPVEGYGGVKPDPQSIKKKAQTRVREEIRTETLVIEPETVYEFSRTVGPGRLVKKSNGVPGKVVKTFAVRFENGSMVSKHLLTTKKVDAKPAVYLMGRGRLIASRGGKVTRSEPLEMEATAYDPSAGRGEKATFRTATGMRAQFGIAAVDPKVIPLGTHLWIEGYGYALAADTGGAIKGMKIDLCYDTYREAIQFGRRKVKVYILGFKGEPMPKLPD